MIFLGGSEFILKAQSHRRISIYSRSLHFQIRAPILDNQIMAFLSKLSIGMLWLGSDIYTPEPQTRPVNQYIYRKVVNSSTLLNVCFRFIGAFRSHSLLQ
jgi:hypothetical protein